jgi:hypothetical protein
MSEKRQPGVIGSLPSTRPHRRSGKRAAPAAAADAIAPAAATPPTEAKPAAKPVRAKPAAARTQAANRTRTRTPPPAPESPAPEPTSPGALQTALEATVELTEIGVRASARALRLALSRLPKP